MRSARFLANQVVTSLEAIADSVMGSVRGRIGWQGPSLPVSGQNSQDKTYF